MIPVLTADWIWLAILIGGLFIGVGIRGIFADRARRRMQEDARQESLSAQYLLAESVGQRKKLEHELAELRAAGDGVRRNDEQLRLELARAKEQIMGMDLLALRLRASEQLLRDQQAGWQDERLALERQIAASSEAILGLDDTRNQLGLAEARIAALQTQHDERIALLVRQLKEQDATAHSAAERGGEAAKLRSRLAELEPRARMAADWQARHDIVQQRLAESDNDRTRLRHRLAEVESRITQLDNSLEERDVQIRRITEQTTLAGQRGPRSDEKIIQAQVLARENRIRELENNAARLRQRVLELEPLRGELQVREQRLRELQLLAQLKDAAYDEEIARLSLRVAELEGRMPDIKPAGIVQEDRQGQSM
jgi:chromosome segregation ATPase